MIDINELRQSLGAVTPEEIDELLDRLEAAESEAIEQARLLGMSGEREAALLSKLEAAEKETASWKGLAKQFGNEADALRVEVERLTECLHRANAQAEHFEREWYLRGEEVDALCAEVQTWKLQSESYWQKIESMEKQEPIAWMGRGPRDGRIEFSVYKPSPSVMRDFNVIPLYTLPGAKGDKK
jgi:chromosome segregation ATPase